MPLRRKEKNKPKILSPGFVYLIQKLSRVHTILAFYCSNVNSYSSAPESNRPNPLDRTMDLPFFFRYKHVTTLKHVTSPISNESLHYWFRGKFCGYVYYKFRVEKISFVFIR